MDLNNANSLKGCGHPVHQTLHNTLLEICLLWVVIGLNSLVCANTSCFMFPEWVGMQSVVVFQGKKDRFKEKNCPCKLCQYSSQLQEKMLSMKWSGIFIRLSTRRLRLHFWLCKAFACGKCVGFFPSFEIQTCGPLFQGPAASKKQVFNNSESKMSFLLWPHSSSTTCLATSLPRYTGSLQRKFPCQGILGQVKTE